MESIPKDVLQLTLGHLDDEDLAITCMLNKNFSNKICNDNFWRNRIISRFSSEKFKLTPKIIDKYKGNNTYWAYYNYLSNFVKSHSFNINFDLERKDLVIAWLNSAIFRYSDLLLMIVSGLRKNVNMNKTNNKNVNMVAMKYIENINDRLDATKIQLILDFVRKYDHKVGTQLIYLMYDYVMPVSYKYFLGEVRFIDVLVNKLIEFNNDPGVIYDISDLYNRRYNELINLSKNILPKEDTVYQHFLYDTLKLKQ